MSDFTDRELEYLSERRLGRIATVGRDGTPHVVPVGWRYDPDRDAIEVGGHDFASTKKFRDVRRGGRAAIVIDDLASTDPWRPRGIEVRGRAEAIEGSGRWSGFIPCGSSPGASRATRSGSATLVASRSPGRAYPTTWLGFGRCCSPREPSTESA